jgi:hypothetical protein
MSVEQSVEWESAGEAEVLGENLPQCYFVHHKSYIWSGLEPGRRRGKPATNRLSYGTASWLYVIATTFETNSAELYTSHHNLRSFIS